MSTAATISLKAYDETMNPSTTPVAISSRRHAAPKVMATTATLALATHANAADIAVIAGSALPLGIPYGIYRDPQGSSLLVGYLGTSDTAHDGGIAVFGGR